MVSAVLDIVNFTGIFSARLDRRSFIRSLAVSCLFLFVTSLSAQTGPGGVGNSTTNLLWLKADAGTSTTVNGEHISDWLDQSGNLMNASQSILNRQPKFTANAVNGRPSVLLNNAADGLYDNFKLPSGFSNFSNGLSAFVVTKLNSTLDWSNFFNLGGGAPNLYDEAIPFSRNGTTDELWYEVLANGSDSYISRPALTTGDYQILSVRQDAGAPLAPSSARLYKNNTQLGPVGTTLVPKIFVRTDNYIGHDSWNKGDIDAEIAEIIIFNTAVNNAQRNIIANYLSSKYGIVIGLSDKYIYDAGNGYDVAGIGQVDITNFHNNATSAGILNISNPSSLGNGDYLLFGHNNGSIASWTTTEAPADALNLSYLRIAREWRVDKTAGLDVGTVTITGDFSQLPPVTAGYTIMAMLVDNDGDFTSGAVTYPLTNAGPNKYQVANVTLNDGDFITYAIYKINNDDPCTAHTVSVGTACNFQTFSNIGASNSAVPDPGSCDGTGFSGYTGGDVWLKFVVPASGNVIINSNTESTSQTNREWLYRVGFAVYSGACGGLTKISCQISPLTVIPPADVNLSISGQTPGETLYVRVWDWDNNDNGKFYFCVYDPCLIPPVITGSIAPTTVEGCLSGNATPAVNTVAALEALGLNISDGCTPDAALVVTHADAFSGTCPIIVTRTYTVTDASSSSSTYNQIINVDDNTPPGIVGAPDPTNIEGCTLGMAPVALTTVAALQALPGGMDIIDACTADAALIVSHTDASAGTCPIVITRTYKITDACGNFVYFNHIINIDDNTPPLISGTLTPVSLEGCGTGDAPAAVTTVAALKLLPGGLTISDICTAEAGLVVTHTDAVSGTCPTIITRTYKIADACGNFVTTNQTINIDDNTKPVIAGSFSIVNIEGCSAAAAPAAVATVAALEGLPGGITVTDACTSDALLSVSHTDAITGTCPVVITRTYTITDECLNFITVDQTINVDDNTAPAITGSLNAVNLEGCNAGAAPPAVSTVAALEALAGTVSVTDACSPDASLIVTHSDVSVGTCPMVVTRTYTVTDACGNFSTVNQTINIDDNTAPVVAGALLAATVEGCNIGAAPAGVTTVADLEALGGAINITDACTADALLSVSHTDVSSGTCPIVVTRTYRVTDVCGNFVTFNHTINVDDNTPPLISGALTPVNLEGCSAATAPAAVTTAAALQLLPGGITITDACTILSSLLVTHTDAVASDCPVVITRTYTVADACGNSADVIQTINIDDNTAPVVGGTLTPVLLEGCGAADAPASVTTVAELEGLTGGITITDACTSDAALIVSFADVVTNTCPIEITRTYTVTDACGNFTDISQTIKIDDKTPPAVSGSLSQVTLEGCSAGDAPAAVTSVTDLENLAGNISISDACTTDALLTVSHLDAVSGTCPEVITRTYTVTDVCGNLVDINQTIKVDDNTSPVLTGTLDPLTLEGCNLGIAPAAVTNVTDLEALPGGIDITDACTAKAALTVSHADVVSGTCPIVITRTYTVSDGCGNYVNVIHTINVDDNTPPSVTGTLSTVTLEGCSASDAPAAVSTVAALELLPGDIIISDICTAKSSITVSHTDVASGTCPVTITRKYRLTDACSNSTDINQIISIEDHTAPEVVGTLAPSTLEGCISGDVLVPVATVADLEALPGNITITDACTADALLTVTNLDVITSTCPIVITRTYKVTDECGNFITLNHILNVDDKTPPVVTGTLSALNIEGCNAGAAPAAVTTVAALESLSGGVLTIADACTAAVSLVVSHTDAVAGTCPIIVTRTYTVKDACGNFTDIVQTINIDDNTSPVITGTLSPVTVEGCNLGDAPVAAVTVAEIETLTGNVTIADGCTPNALLAVSHSDAITGTCPIIITREYTITDKCLNIATVSQIINIDDTTPPSFTVPPDITIYKDATCGYDASTSKTGDVTDESDNCALTLDATYLDLVSAGTCAGSQIITRTWSLSDACANNTSHDQIITILDDTAPVFTAPADITIYKNGACGFDSSTTFTGDVTDESDNCDITLNATFLDIVSAGVCIGEEIVTRTWSLTDDCGNTTSHDQIITVRDNSAPSFTVPPDITIYKDINCSYDASPAITGDVSDEADNCDNTLNATFSDIVSNGSCEGEQIITRTWSLTDDCTNVTTHIQIITVKDNTPPAFTVPADITIYKDAVCGFNASVAITGDVTDEADNCDNTLNATYTDALSAGSCTGEEIITRTWSLTDDCNNTATHVQIITVLDNTTPSFTAPSEIYICRNANCTYNIDPLVTGDVTDEHDNCSTGLNATYSDDSSGATDCNTMGIITRTWSLTDNCGNAAADQIQIIYVNPLPVMSVTVSDAVLCHQGESVDFSISTPNTVNPAGQWRYDVSVVYPAAVTGSWSGGLTNQTLTTLTDNLTNTGEIAGTAVYTFTPHIKPGDGGTDCQNSVPVVISIQIDPQPKIAVTTDPVLCYDGDAIFNISTVNTAVSTGGQWRYDVSVTYPADVTGSWSGGLTDQTLTTLTDNLSNSGDVVRTVVYTFTPHIRPGDGGSDCGNGVPIVLNVQIDPQPKIAVTTDPVLCYDGDATFNISTLNTAVSTGGQWRYDVSVVYPANVTGSWSAGLTNQTLTTLTDNLTNSGDVAGTVIYTFTPHIKPGDGGTDCQSGIPIVLSVQIDPQPKIAVTTDNFLCYDGAATFNISTVNTMVSTGGQWRYDVSVVYPADVTGSWTGGLTDQTLTTLTDNLSNSGNVVRTVVYTFTPHVQPGDGGSDCRNGLPIVLSVQIDPQPKIAVTTDPVLCYDGDATFNISTVNTAVSTGGQWRYDVSVVYPAGVTGSWLAGLTNQTLTTLTDNLTNSGDVAGTVVYTFTPHIKPGDAGTDCQNGVPTVISVQIDPQPKITVTTDPVLCYDGDATFNISTVNTTVSTGGQWRYDVSVTYPANVTGSWSGGLINQTLGTLTDNLTNNGNVAATVVYTFTPHVKPGDGGPECPDAVPVIVSVQIDPQPKIAVTTDPVLCYDGDAIFNISTVNTAVSTGGQWRYDVSVTYPADVTGSWAGGLTDQTLTTLTDNLTNSGDVVRTVVYTFTPHIRPGDGGTDCQNGIPVVLSIQIDPQPKLAVTTDPVLCYDGDATFNISTVNTAVSAGGQWRYDVSVVYPANVTGSWSAGLTNQTLTTLTDNLTNSGDVAGTVIYTFTPHIKPGDGGTDCQSGIPIVLSVQIDPQPKIAVTTDNFLCYDGAATFNISTVNTMVSTGGQWRYDVSVVYPADVTGSWTGGLTDQTLTTLTDNLSNSGNVVRTVVYTFTPHVQPGDGGSDCRNGLPIVLSVQIDPQPKIAVTTDPVLCYDGDATFNISTVNTAVSTGGQWRYDVSVVYPAGVTGSWLAGLTNQTLTTLTDNLTNSGDVAGTVVYTFTPHIKPGDAGTDCQNGVPTVISVQIDPQPKITVTTDPVLCYDGDAVFNISTVNTTVSTGGQWRYDVSVTYPANVTGSWSGGLINQTLGTLTDNLTNNGNVAATVVYTFTPHVKPGDGGSDCPNAVPVIVSVQIDPQPKIAVTTDPVLCYDGDAIFNISTVNTAVSTGGQWRYDVSVTYPADVTGSWAGGLTNQTLTTLTDNLTNSGDVVRTVVYTFTPHIRPGDGGSDCQNGLPVIVSLQIDPQPKITVTTAPVLCFDGDAAFNISTVNTTVSTGGQWRYDLSVTYPAGVTGTLPAGLVNQTLAAQTDNLTNNGDIAATVVYTFTPHIRPGDGGSECQNGVVTVVNVIVNPQPRVFPVPVNSIQCDSTLTDIKLQSPSIFSSGAITFDQTVTSNSRVSGYSTPLSGLPNDHIIADRLKNVSDTFQVVNYTIVPVSPTGCANGIAIHFTVTVNPTPRVIPINTNLKSDSSICFGGSTRVVLTTPTVMTSGAIRFNYTVSVSGAPGVVTGDSSPATDRMPGSAISFPYQNSSDTIQSVYYNITPRVNNAICVDGKTVRSEVKIHAKPLQNLIISTPLTCDGGSDASLTAITSKGAGLYYFDWVRTTVDQVHGYNIPELLNRKGGRWDLKVTDNLSCTNSSFIYVEGAYLDSYMYVVDTTGYGTTCAGSNDGQIWIKEKNSSTGIAPFEYWIVRNSQDTVIHSTLPGTEILQTWNNQLPGNYKLYIKDSNGCYDINYPEATIIEPDQIIVTLEAAKYTGDNNISCTGYSDGSAWVQTVSGGNGTYRYKWSTTNGTISTVDTLDRLDNITAGTYYLRVTDRKGCITTDSIKLIEPDGMRLISTQLHHGADGIYNFSCNGGSDGSIIINIEGGSGNFTYLWTGPNLFTATAKDISGLKAGRYICTVTDVNGCILTPSPDITLTEPLPLAISSLLPASADGAYSINCSGGTGSVDITVSGGITGTYQYTWSTADGSGIVAGSEDQSSLKAGTYHVKVKDLNGCENSIDFTLTQPSPLLTAFDVTHITCISAAFDDGIIDLTVSGGIAPYAYSWSNGQVTEDISGLIQGYYKVVVTDSNGCTKTDSVRVNLPPPLTYSKSISSFNGFNISCKDMANGFIMINPTSGTPPYIYSWTGPDGYSASVNDITDLKAGEYILTLTDDNSCTATEIFDLTEPDSMKITVNVSESLDGMYNLSCAGVNTGSIDIISQNTIGTVSYLWDDGASGSSRTGLPAGDYSVIVKDANNCHVSAEIILTAPDPMTIRIDTIKSPTCTDKPDGQIRVKVEGGIKIPATDYLFEWSNHSTDSVLYDIPAGFYKVSVQDLNGCIIKDSIRVVSENDICLSIPNAISPNDDGINDVWNIGLIDLYPNADVVVFNRWGETVWRSEKGYPHPWDGRSNGRMLPVDSYHYIINLHNGSKLILGSITIVK